MRRKPEMKTINFRRGWGYYLSYARRPAEEERERYRDERKDRILMLVDEIPREIFRGGRKRYSFFGAGNPAVVVTDGEWDML